MPTDESRYGIYGALALLAAGLIWGCYHGRVRKHTLPELHRRTATLEAEPTMSGHLL
jgi:hypothetical protein